jgi:hypothetical protein
MARFEACLLGVALTLACTNPTAESRSSKTDVQPRAREVATEPPREPCTCDADDRRRGRPSRDAALYIQESRTCEKANGGPANGGPESGPASVPAEAGCNPDAWLLEEVAACIVCRQTAGPRLTDGWYLKFRDGRMRWGVVEHRLDRDVLIRHEVDANDGSYHTVAPPTHARLIYERGASTDPCGADLPSFTEAGYEQAQRELDERHAETLAAAERNEANSIEFCDYGLQSAALMFRRALGMVDDPSLVKVPDAAARTASASLGLIEMAIAGCQFTATDWYGRAEAMYLGFAAATHVGNQAGATRWREQLQREYPGHAFTARALDCQ